MADPFEYDVFISFSSADEEVVKPLWQELCSNGLRVFWSDSTLKKEVGNSWLDVIQKSLERSKHMLLVCSDNSMSSKWVQREYMAFYSDCYSPDSRRLIPVLMPGFRPTKLPLFARQLQAVEIRDPHLIKQLIPLLGGVNIEELRSENQSLKEQVNSLLQKNTLLKDKLKDKNHERSENRALRGQVDSLLHENKLLKQKLEDKSNERLRKDEAQRTTEEALVRAEGVAADARARADELARQLRERGQDVVNDVGERGQSAIDAVRKTMKPDQKDADNRREEIRRKLEELRQERTDDARERGRSAMDAVRKKT